MIPFLLKLHRPESLHFGWTLVTVVGLSMTAGCSLNEAGFVKHERFEANGAYVHSVIAYGLHIDTRDTDPSVSLGRYGALYVFPVQCRGTGNVANLGDKVLFPSVAPQLSYSLVDGLQLKAGRSEMSATVGVREHLVALDVDPLASVVRKIYFDPENPHDTILKIDAESDCIRN